VKVLYYQLTQKSSSQHLEFIDRIRDHNYKFIIARWQIISPLSFGTVVPWSAVLCLYDFLYAGSTVLIPVFRAGLAVLGPALLIVEGLGYRPSIQNFQLPVMAYASD
jgi:hypothetical protein